MRRSDKQESAEQAVLRESEEWESGERGAAAVSAVASSDEGLAVDEALGLQMISIRLPVGVIEQLKARAADEGLKYQPYMRRVLIEHIKQQRVEERVTRLEQQVAKLAR